MELLADKMQPDFVRDQVKRWRQARLLSLGIIAASVAHERGDLAASANLMAETAKTALMATGRETLVTVRMDQVVFKKSEWLWYGRIPRSSLTVVSGEGGKGKGLITYNIATAVTRGNELPDEKGETLPGSPRTPRSVLMLLGNEEPREQVTVWRLYVAGADLSRIDITNKYQAPDGRTVAWSLANVEAVRNYLSDHPDIVPGDHRSDDVRFSLKK